jgi:hypothetical protein
MKRVLRFGWWLLFNGAFAACIYLGYWREINGAQNIAMFMAWVAIVTGWFLLSDKVLRELLAKRGPSVPRWLSHSFDVAVCGAFVWLGFWVTAAFYLFHISCMERYYQKADEARKGAS